MQALAVYFLLRFGAGLLGTCDSALPAAVFDALLVRPSRRTFEAALAAFGLVTLFTILHLLSPHKRPVFPSGLTLAVCFWGYAPFVSYRTLYHN